MFISTPTRAGYDRHGSQFAHGYMVLLMQPDEHVGNKDMPIRVLVRYVRLRQLGHFMMGRITVKGHKLSVSGAYGNMGLTMDVPKEVYELGTPLPQELRDAWNTGGGHNSAGREGPAIRAWAQKTIRYDRGRCPHGHAFATDCGRCNNAA